MGLLAISCFHFSLAISFAVILQQFEQESTICMNDALWRHVQVIDALASFPLAVDEERLPNIYQLAPTTKESLGNTAYLIVRPGKGNVMIDVPR